MKREGMWEMGNYVFLLEENLKKLKTKKRKMIIIKIKKRKG